MFKSIIITTKISSGKQSVLLIVTRVFSSLSAPFFVVAFVPKLTNHNFFSVTGDHVSDGC